MRRIIPEEHEDAVLYLILSVIMIYVAFNPIGIPLPISDMTVKWFDTIEALGEGDIVLIDEGSLNWFTNTQVSLAIYKHLKTKVLEDDVRLVFFTTAGTAGIIAMDRLWPLVGFDDMEYGVQYVWLGWLPGGETAFANIREDVWACFETDHFGTKLEDLPLMAEVHTLQDFEIAMRSCNTSPDDFMRQWSGRGVKVLCNNGASAIPLMMPYIDNDLMTAYMTTMNQCAEYEKLLGVFGLPTKQMDAQSIAQIYLAILAVFGNILYWRQRRAQDSAAEEN